MQLYFAPMEGITGYIFRNAFNEFFGQGVDKYFTPFLTPCEKRAISAKEVNEVSTENNKGINLVPQIITANADDFNMVKNRLRDIGYDEINLNLGCPSRTVTSKGRGAGALENLDSLKFLLDGIFADNDKSISIKTRIGISDPEEFQNILNIYIQYPIKELIIHPRVLEEMYKGHPHIDVFTDTLSNCPFPLCYNGDVNSVDDYNRVIAACHNTNSHINAASSDESCMDDYSTNKPSAIMIGRGALMNPALFREITGGACAGTDEIYSFLKKLRKDYTTVMSGQRPVLFKMKEIWSYLRISFPEHDKTIKKIMKTNSLNEYDLLVQSILH